MRDKLYHLSPPNVFTRKEESIKYPNNSSHFQRERERERERGGERESAGGDIEGGEEERQGTYVRM